MTERHVAHPRPGHLFMMTCPHGQQLVALNTVIVCCGRAQKMRAQDSCCCPTVGGKGAGGTTVEQSPWFKGGSCTRCQPPPNRRFPPTSPLPVRDPGVDVFFRCGLRCDPGRPLRLCLAAYFATMEWFRSRFSKARYARSLLAAAAVTAYWNWRAVAVVVHPSATYSAWKTARQSTMPTLCGS